MLKKLSILLLLFLSLNSFGVSYTTVTDECPYIRFSGTTLRDVVVAKSQVKLQQTDTKVSVVFLSGGAQTLSWDSPQARAYGYSLDSLYLKILNILKVQCDSIESDGVTQATLDDSLVNIHTTINSLRKVDTLYKKATNRDLTYFKINGIEYSFKDSIGGAQTLSRTFADSISLSISGGNTVKLPYAVDSVGATSDSIIVYKFGIRKSYTNGSSGGASLSGLTAATATNTIDNAAYQQSWSWNSLTSGTGLKLSSNSTLASGNLQTVLEVVHSGTNATSLLKTFAARITSDKGSNSNANTALYLSATGVSGLGLSNSRALEINSGEIYINSSGTVNPSIRWSGGSYLYDNTLGLMTFSTPATINTGISFMTNAVFGVQGTNHFSGTQGWGLSNLATSRNALMLGAAGYFGGYCSGQTSAVVLERDADVFSISADNAISGGFFTPTKIVSVRGSTGNMGIGTQTPVTSALLDLTSTTKGLLIPRATYTQITAISTPATGLQMYHTNQNQMAVYNGTNWTGGLSISSAGTLTLTYGTDFIFEGTTATWTLPAIVSGIAGRQNSITIKNRGSGSITLNTNASANVLYDTSLVNTITITAGSSCVIMPDGTYLNKE